MDFFYTSNSTQNTLYFAKQLASRLQKKDVIILTGELGSGKTKFVEGILSYFGLENYISSPTYTIVNEYDAPNFPIFHFDVYRLQDVSEFYEIGGEEYFETGLSIVEWGEVIKEALPKEYIQICFEKNDNDDNVRTLKISTFGERFSNYFDWGF